MKLFFIEFLSLIVCLLYQTTRAHILVYRVDTSQFIAEFSDLPAQFGPSVPPNGVKVYPIVADPVDACAPIKPPPKTKLSPDKKYVAIIRRGGDCTFEKKIRNAQAVGFHAVIVYNNYTDDLEQMSAKNSTGINITSVFVGHTFGLELTAEDTYKYVLVINDELPFNINTQLILPFSILIGLCFLVMIFYMIYKCIREERRLRRYRLPKRLLKKLPIIKYTKTNDLAYDTCVICLEDFAEGDKLRILPCRHPYHTHCIDPWLTENRRVCPICKRKVFTKGEARSHRNRQSSLDSVTDTDDDTTPLLQPSNNAAGAVSGAASGPTASTTTRHGTFRRNGAAATDDTTSDDENVLLTHQTSRRMNPFDRTPNLPPNLSEQLNENSRSGWLAPLLRFFRRSQSISVVAPAFLDEVVPNPTGQQAPVNASSGYPVPVVLPTQNSNNILNPNLAGSFKDDDDILGTVNDESPPQSIYEPIQSSTSLTVQPSTETNTEGDDVDAPFIQTPAQGGIGVVALPNSSNPNSSNPNIDRQFIV